MKKFINIITALAIAAAAAVAAGCSNTFEEIDSLVLNRCLEPTGLSAKVVASKGNDIVFSWNVGKDAESYTLKVYTDKAMTDLYVEKVLSPDQVPFTMSVLADATYYYMVQATSESKEASNWATYQDDSKNPKSIKTFAVKDNLYLAVAERGSESISLTWSKEVSDYADVTNIYFGAPGCSEEDLESYTLTAEDIQNASATVSGLTPSQEYVMSLYYLSASRGEVNVWTMPDPNGLTSVTTSAQLEQAIKDGAKALVKIDGSPYSIGADLAKGLDVTKGFELYGEGAADGTMPVIYGSINITDSFDGKGVYCEGIEFNGQSNKCGFLFQHKEGSTANDVVVGNVIFRNCVITGYSKGLAYEWGKTMKIGEFTFDGCDIHAVNADGSGGGDGFDIRQATTIDKLNFTHCTIYNGFRTFLRIDANPIIGDVVFNNNTVMNLCFVDNTNNGGIFAFQAAPGSLSIKNNLFLNLVEKTTLTSANTKYKNASDLAVAASSNYFYGCAETISTDNMTVANLAGTTLDADPCYNAKAGLFNLNPDSDIAGQKIGASKWWTPFVEEPEDLTLGTIKAAHTWNLNNAKYFSGTSKKQMVRDSLFISASENNPIALSDGMIAFANASVCTKKGVPTDGYLYFKVDRPGSLVIRPVDGGANHIVVATGAENASLVTVKGGASEMSNMSNAQKIVISDITEETCVYIYASGAIALDKLAWSNDISQVNTALPAPAPAASPATVTAGEAEDVVITWEAVENAGSYSVVFNGKTYIAEELEYALPSNMIKMLDAGSYKVDVFANPTAEDIYNTQSAAGSCAFAVVPAGGSDDEGGEFIVKNVEELSAALSAGKTEITMAPGAYALTETLVVPANLYLKKQAGEARPQITGAVKIKGENNGDIVFDGLEFIGDASNANCFTVSNKTGDAATEDFVSATSVTIRDCYIHDYAKSVWYNPKGNKTTTESSIGSLRLMNNIIKNCTTGQNTIDIRDGHYDEVLFENNTFDGCAVTGAELFRIDDTQNGLVEITTLIVRNNTIYNCSAASGKAVFYIRENLSTYSVTNNLFLMPDGYAGKLSRLAVVKPGMKNNFYYNPGADFFTGDITEDGTVLAACPVKNMASSDFTLTNALVISCNAGARRWNPNYTESSSSSFKVANAEELAAALSAGKTAITLEAGTYEVGAMTCVAGLRLTGASSTDKPVITGSFKIAGENNGSLVFENIVFQGDASNTNCFTVSNKTGDAATDYVSANSVIFRNCQFKDYTKSVWYNPKGNKTTYESEIGSVLFDGCRFTNNTTGQNTIDIRDGKYTSFTVSNSTFESCAVTGADLIRIDNTQNGLVEIDGVVIRNNTFYNCGSASGKAILYMREDCNTYVFQNNVVLGTETSAGLLSRARVALGDGYIPATLGNNFYFSVGANMFGEKDDIKADYGTVLTASPVKNAAAGDYTLTNALVMSCNAGARTWNPTAGSRVDPNAFFSVASQDEFDAAVSAGKTNILMKTNAESYSLTAYALGEGTYLKGEIKNGKKPSIVGSFKLVGNVGNITLENLDLAGDGSNANCITVSNVTGDAAAENVTGGNIVVKNCDIHDYTKSVWYNPKGNKTTPESELTSVKITGCTIKNCTTGQNTIDVRDGKYGTFTVERCTFVNCAVSGAEVFRVDYTQNGLVEMGAMVIKDNTFYNCSSASGKAILYNRAPFAAYTFANNLVLGTETSAGLLARARVALEGDYIAPSLSGNYYFSVGANMFGEKDDIKADYGTVLEADPCISAATGNFKLKVAIAAGDPRWR